MPLMPAPPVAGLAALQIGLPATASGAWTRGGPGGNGPRGWGGAIVAEVAGLFRMVRGCVRTRGFRGLALGPIGAAVTVSVALWQHYGWAPGALAAWTAESVALPLTMAIIRLPGSLVATAPQLPVWGAVAQVLVVLVLAQAALGIRRTLALTLLAQCVSSGAGRIMAHLGPHTFLGLSPASVALRDTGPSAATVSLAVAVGLTCRARRLTAILVAALITASFLQPGLAASEHLVAIALGFAWFLGSRLRSALGGGRPGSQAPADGPALQTVDPR